MSKLRIPAILTIMTLLVATPLDAQREPAIDAAADSAGSTEDMVIAGLLGGAIGMFIGGAVGYGAEVTLADQCVDWCGLGGMLIGGVLGEAIGMGFGVHAANGRRGSFMGAAAGPIALVGAGLLVGTAAVNAGIPPIVVVVTIPVAQLITSIHGERAAMERSP